jgi:hypothetical protein
VLGKTPKRPLETPKKLQSPRASWKLRIRSRPRKKPRNGEREPRATRRREFPIFIQLLLPCISADLFANVGLINREAAAAKKAEADRKKAEKEALLREEEAALPSGPKKSKQAVKKSEKPSRGLDLSQLDDSPSTPSALNATGIDNALDALDITSGAQEKLDRHPERRFKAAYAAFEERRLAEMDEDGSGKGLRRNQKIEQVRKEFEKHPDNPFNQARAAYNASRDEMFELKQKEIARKEAILASPTTPTTPGTPKSS